MEPSILWLLAGITLIGLEAFGVSGVGLLFAGFGAVVVALIVKSGVIAETDYIMQCIGFFAFTALWAALLWKPMKTMRKGTKAYSNIVGQAAVVDSSGLTRSGGGNVQWSGTVMRAKLDAYETAEQLEAGAHVVITALEGNTLIVKKKA